jgi:hypothetical protein
MKLQYGLIFILTTSLVFTPNIFASGAGETVGTGSGILAGAAAGAQAGAHMGIALGPLGAISGTVVFGIIGGIVGGLTGNNIGHRIDESNKQNTPPVTYNPGPSWQQQEAERQQKLQEATKVFNLEFSTALDKFTTFLLEKGTDENDEAQQKRKSYLDELGQLVTKYDINVRYIGGARTISINDKSYNAEAVKIVQKKLANVSRQVVESSQAEIEKVIIHLYAQKEQNINDFADWYWGLWTQLWKGYDISHNQWENKVDTTYKKVMVKNIDTSEANTVIANWKDDSDFILANFLEVIVYCCQTTGSSSPPNISFADVFSGYILPQQLTKVSAIFDIDLSEYHSAFALKLQDNLKDGGFKDSDIENVIVIFESPSANIDFDSNNIDTISKLCDASKNKQGLKIEFAKMLSNERHKMISTLYAEQVL